MRRLVWAVLLVAFFGTPAFAQSQLTVESEIKQAVPYSRMLRDFPDMTLDEYNAAVRLLAKEKVKEDATLQPLYRPPSTGPEPRTLYRPPDYTLPRARTTYDWQSGNTYTTRKRFNGDTEVNGSNARTGSIWNTTIKPDGSMNGLDSDMNPWTYDSRTKTYMNYGTGKMCIGEGAARVCF